MTKIHEKIMRIDFAKSFKRLIILMVCVVLLGGGMSAAMLTPQIGETVSYARKWEHDSDSRQEKSDLESGSEYHGDKEEHRHKEDDFF